MFFLCSTVMILLNVSCLYSSYFSYFHLTDSLKRSLTFHQVSYTARADSADATATCVQIWDQLSPWVWKAAVHRAATGVESLCSLLCVAPQGITSQICSVVGCSAQSLFFWLWGNVFDLTLSAAHTQPYYLSLFPFLVSPSGRSLTLRYQSASVCHTQTTHSALVPFEKSPASNALHFLKRY